MKVEGTGPEPSLTACMYMQLCVCVYIYAVESKLCPKMAFFESKLGPSVLLVFLLCYSKIFFFLQGE